MFYNNIFLEYRKWKEEGYTQMEQTGISKLLTQGSSQITSLEASPQIPVVVHSGCVQSLVEEFSYFWTKPES